MLINYLLNQCLVLQEFQLDIFFHNVLDERHVTSKPALSRVKPPGPNAETLLLWVISDNGLVWSINWDKLWTCKKIF